MGGSRKGANHIEAASLQVRKKKRFRMYLQLALGDMPNSATIIHHGLSPGRNRGRGLGAVETIVEPRL